MPIPEIFPAEIVEGSNKITGQEAIEASARVLYLTNSISSLQAVSPTLRLGAFAIDFALLNGFALCLSEWVGVLMLRVILRHKGMAVSGDAADIFAEALSYATNIIWPLAMLFLGFAYYVTFIHLWGKTIGKGLLGICVVSRIGEKPSLEMAGKRFLASVVTFFSAGLFFFFGAYGRDGICFHDEASGTRVVRKG